MTLIRRFFILLLLLGLALVLRLPLLTGSFWLDEAAQALESARPLSQQLDIIADFQPPLIHLLVHFALFFSQSEWWLRTVAALTPGLGIIALSYLVGRRISSERVAIVTALLLATSSFHIFYSQELRPYALPALWAALSWWLILVASRAFTKAPRKVITTDHSVQWWLAFSLVTALGLYSSYLYPFLVMGQLVYIAWQERSQLRSFLLSVTMAAVSFGPWLPTFSQQLAAGERLRQFLPGWSEVVSTPQLKALPLVILKFIFGVLDIEPTGWYLLALALVIGTSGLLAWHLRQSWATTLSARRERQKILVFLGCWLIIPVVTAWVISFWVPVVQPKRVLMVMPAWYLFITYLAANLSQSRWRVTAWLLPVLLLVINCLSAWSYYTQPRLQREDWRSLHHRIIDRYPADRSLVIFAFDAPFAPWRWYDDHSYPTLSLEPLAIPNDEALAEKMKHITQYQYVLVFDYLRDLSDPQDRLGSQVEAFGYQPVEALDQPNIGFVRVYSRPEVRLSHRVE
jgi:uncharacterized membrane protein